MLIKIDERLIKTFNDSNSFHELGNVLRQYSTDDGYRVESFISPNFIRITVYKEEK